MTTSIFLLQLRIGTKIETLPVKERKQNIWRGGSSGSSRFKISIAKLETFFDSRRQEAAII